MTTNEKGIKDYYGILGLSYDATKEEIEANFAQLAIETHPISHPEDDPKVWQDRWADVMEAGAILKNATTKKAYDKELKNSFKSSETEKENQGNKEDANNISDSAQKGELVVLDLDKEKKKDDTTTKKRKKRRKKRGLKVVKADKSEDAAKKADKAKRKINKKTVAVTAAVILLAALALHSCHKKGEPIEEAITDENNMDDSTLTEETLIEIEDPYIDTPVYAFTDAFNDEQVHNRAMAIHEYFERSNLHNISVEDIETAIKYINCAYIVDENENVSVELNNALETTLNIFAEYGTAINKQPSNFAGGVVDENGVQVALGYDAFVVDDTPNADFLREASMLFQNTLTSSVLSDKVEASKQMLKQEADMMAWLEVDGTDTTLSFANLNSTEGFIYGLMVQAAAPTIKSALGEDYAIAYTDNVGGTINLGISAVEGYYSQTCDGQGWNVWNNHLININGMLLNINDPGVAFTYSNK